MKDENNIINFITNISIVIHLFHEDLLEEFIVYINNVKNVFKNVNVIFTLKENSDFDSIIKEKDPTFIVLKVENKGVDIYSFLESVKYIRENHIKTDYILKLHTKKSNTGWRKELINPITNPKTLMSLQHYFKFTKNIGYVASQKWVIPKNFDLFYQNNIRGVKNILEKFPHLEKNWTDFVGGTMFWINNKVLNEYLTEELIEYFISNFSSSKPISNEETEESVPIEYLCERILTGAFCYNKTNILVNQYKGYYREPRPNLNETFEDINFYQPGIISFNIPKNTNM